MQKDLPANTARLQSGFIGMSCGHNLLYACRAPQTPRAVLILPPFAEEMNKIRHLLSALMRKLADAGTSCFMLDNYGTGDSEGDLDTASCAIWRADLLKLLNMLRDEGYSQVSFIAVRFGSLQLFDLLNHAQLPLKPQQIVLWQPIFDVAKFWQQFVRIKVAEVMARGTKISQKDLEQQLDAGQTIEIAGYPISPAFFCSLQHLQTALPNCLSKFTLSWFETSQLDTVALTVQQQLQQLQPLCAVNFVPIKAEPYWKTAELANADELIAQTLQQLTAGKQ